MRNAPRSPAAARAHGDAGDADCDWAFPSGSPLDDDLDEIALGCAFA